MIPEVAGAVIVAGLGCLTLGYTATLRFIQACRPLDPKKAKREILNRRRDEVRMWDCPTEEKLAEARTEIRRLDEALLALEGEEDE